MSRKKGFVFALQLRNQVKFMKKSTLNYRILAGFVIPPKKYSRLKSLENPNEILNFTNND